MARTSLSLTRELLIVPIRHRTSKVEEFDLVWENELPASENLNVAAEKMRKTTILVELFEFLFITIILFK